MDAEHGQSLAQGRRRCRVDRLRQAQRRVRALPEDGQGRCVRPTRAARGALGRAAALLSAVNTVAAVASAIAMGVAGCVLTWEATARYLFKIPSDWQDELSIFLLVGATFLSAAWVQERRGHVGIQALGAILPPAADRMRRYVSDIVTLVFCAFFCWKSLVAADRGGEGRPDQRFRMWRTAVDSLWLHGGRHDAALARAARASAAPRVLSGERSAEPPPRER